LIGNDQILGDIAIPVPVQPHSLQDVVEEIVEGMPDALRELYHLRFGNRLSIRAIAREQGFKSHYVVQYRLEKLLAYVKTELEKRGITYDERSTA
jgi:hypothetical protein